MLYLILLREMEKNETWGSAHTMVHKRRWEGDYVESVSREVHLRIEDP